jgi:hypothetical protein
MLAVEQWRTGERYLERLEGAASPPAEDVARAVGTELRRRLGGAFTVQELVDLYAGASGWVLDLAARTAPDHPDAWDPRVADGAFFRYLRHAQDWGGGRLVAYDDED